MKTPLALLLVLVVLQTVCRAAEMHEEIFNGYTARPGQFPFQVLLETHTINDTLNCGGSLISDHHVLTAGHCTHGGVLVNVYFNVTKRGDVNAYVVKVTSSDIYIHPDYEYNDHTLVNDVSILYLSQPVTFSRWILPIALPKSAWSNPNYFNNYLVTASGWGMINDYQTPLSLQYTQLLKTPQNICTRLLAPFNMPFNDQMICTDKKVIYAGVCRGDSGGPLTVRYRNGLYIVGISSWLPGKCSSDVPSVFVNVAHFLDYIHNVTAIPIS